MGASNAIVAVILVLAVHPTLAQEMSYGEAEFNASCAVCHGSDGRGDGPLAAELGSAPTDLTALASSNGGDFPYWKVFAMIDGRYVVPGHGTREMPVWGREFLSADADTYGPMGGEASTRERILALAEYIATLQE